MNLVYRGKTKDVYDNGEDGLRLIFSDRVTKNAAGEIDPGGNTVAESTAPGQGEACLLMASAIFEELAEKNGVFTHMIAYDLPSLSMDVRRGTMFNPGIEWIARWVCTGSFLRRYGMVPGVHDGMRFADPVFEITLKDDAAGDPLIVPSALVALGVVDARTMNALLDSNAKAMQAIHAMFAARDLDLWDIKIEWALDAKGAPMLIDEVSPGCCRAFDMKTKKRVSGIELAERFRR
ncbi:phosphoribosylaminoimidazolesuccinocarboxamide synthase [Desulfovibrio sp.]|uniref:phosphoribosylaminoimidazolesuccinocarboxamide synthase n=1 Tax=Desulfovibrio sp. TaxID=885 RepID=UPI0025BC1622|nr:phosphoribosylaminoimidazolesuccinocarboxamide synthase [Desulfovibrio sp.]